MDRGGRRRRTRGDWDEFYRMSIAELRSRDKAQSQEINGIQYMGSSTTTTLDSEKKKKKLDDDHHVSSFDLDDDDYSVYVEKMHLQEDINKSSGDDIHVDLENTSTSSSQSEKSESESSSDDDENELYSSRNNNGRKKEMSDEDCGSKVISIDEKEFLSSIGTSTEAVVDEKSNKKEAVVEEKPNKTKKKEAVEEKSNKSSNKNEAIEEKSNKCSKKKEAAEEKSNKKKGIGRKTDADELMKILVDSIYAQKDLYFENKTCNTNILPLKLKFRFEDEEGDEMVPQQSECIDALFREMELGLRQSHMDSAHSCQKENDDLTFVVETPAARCGRGDHLRVLDEQIGIVCKYCHTIIMDIKYVIGDFYKRPLSRRAWREPDESRGSTMGPIHFSDPDSRPHNSTTRVKGTVWDLIPGIEHGMFPHQRKGFEFIWRNIAGDIVIANLNQDPSDSRGCIISHAPGTGKTRLTIAFLQTFLKQYPNCCPVIIAPKVMLLNWEYEFSKWNFNVPFHNLNNKDLSGHENEIAVRIWGGVGGKISKEAIRILKLYSWTTHGGILGVSYTLFVKLTQENEKEGLHATIKKVLLERPGLLVLDEGHTPRNDRSLMWKALMKVSTQRRIILSGTPFQNNMNELFNTLSLVNPKFVKQIGCEDHFVRKKWMTLTSSIGKKTNDGLKRLRAMLDQFVDVYKGTILEDCLPGLRHTVVFLHPTDCQKKMLEEASNEVQVFRRTQLVSMASVHPSLKADIKRQTCKIEDVNEGVKMKFLLKLVWLADALGERVLIFGQFLDPLIFIMRQIECHLSWREGRELLYMDGQLDEKQRQDSISSFNDFESEAKVFLASQRACSEGINLVGASRVVLLDTVWNPSMEKQAVSRAYRLGQKKIVHVYRLFTSGVEVRQFAQQNKKVQISELLFSHGDGQPCKDKNASSGGDKLLEAMLDLEGFNAIFEKIIYQPNESDLIDIFGSEGQN